MLSLSLTFRLARPHQWRARGLKSPTREKNHRLLSLLARCGAETNLPDQTSRFESQGTIPAIDAFIYRSVSKEKDMPKDAHNKAAEHHESAARSHKTAAEHHGKGDHGKGREE